MSPFTWPGVLAAAHRRGSPLTAFLPGACREAGLDREHARRRRVFGGVCSIVDVAAACRSPMSVWDFVRVLTVTGHLPRLCVTHFKRVWARGWAVTLVPRCGRARGEGALPS